MATTELVGPVEVIRFVGGLTQVYTPPRDSMDIRYAACRDHHPACDCREAALAEDRNDSAWERAQLLEVFASTLEGHLTWGEMDRRAYPVESGCCMCQGCVIVREVCRRTCIKLIPRPIGGAS